MRLAEEFEDRGSDLLRRAGLADAPREVVVALACVVVAAVVWAGWRWWPRAALPNDLQAPEAAVSVNGSTTATPSRGASAPASATSFVHVVGAVRHPGVYRLPAGARVADAVEAAGGLMPDAVAASVNLARTVTDGEQIVVPDADTASVSGNSASTGSGASANPAKQGAEMVDLNTADESALDALPGIGPATAARIIADREANGPFASAEDLGRVSGIGPKKLEQLSGLVCVR